MSEENKLSPVFKDDTYGHVLKDILSDKMTDSEFTRRMANPLFRLWIKHIIKGAYIERPSGTVGD